MTPAKHAARRELATAAVHAAAFTPDALRQLLAKSGAVESILVLDLIRRAAELSSAVASLASAIEHDSTTEGKV